MPAVLAAKGRPGDLLDNSVREDVRRVVTGLHRSAAVLAEPMKAGRVKVVGARYDLEDGRVDFEVAWGARAGRPSAAFPGA